MIENVVFDLSEVLLPGIIGVEEQLGLRTGKSEDVIARAMGSYPYYEKDNNLDRLLKGELSYESYRAEFLCEIGLSREVASVFDQECTKMFDSPYPYTERMIKNTAKSCNLFLLSDHCETWVEYIRNKHNFFDYFQGLVWSYEIAATKKSTEPFEAIINKYQLNPALSLFVDDNEINIDNAKYHGFKTVHFTGEESINEVYRAIKSG
ncbi:FMN phosphatase YigB (HAD superfamily) [Sinobacterium caligoides]|uniref:FMN phosphatase YigB (HAD superfamily) n=1 Tax=Sinobacterium caligoides TaxID=933926 RepID=A0A3N2E1J6_9GAMM|nr:HAD family hydrolase [Sinobacterium caligoides]ROS05529.1 FMN phosphatase YigB (HAD superfamily) [Sinobacterium caligoides]